MHESLVATSSKRQSSFVVLSAVVGAAAILVALVAQGYLNRRVFLSDAPYVFAWAIALLIVAFPYAAAPASGRDRLGMFVRFLLVLVAGLVTVKVYQDIRHGRDFVVAVALAFLPLMLVGAALAGERKTSRPDAEADVFENEVWRPVKPTAAQHSLDIFFLISGTLLAAVAVAYWFKPGKSNDALILNVLSLVMLFLALYRMDRSKAATAVVPEADTLPPRSELIALLGIMAVAGCLRFWQLDTLPYGVWYDEAQAGQEALRFMEGRLPFTPMGTYTANNPSPFFYLVALAFKITGPSLLTLRTTQALIGLVTVPLLYIFLRYTIGWRAAMIGALMLGVSAWHVNFSRYGMCCNIEAPPFEILTLYFLLRGLRTGKKADFAWGGLMMGFGQFTYAGFRLFPSIIIAYVIYGLVFDKDRMRKSLAGLVIYVVIALVAFAPLGVWAWQHRVEFMARTAQTSVFANKRTAQERQAALTNSLRRHIQMLNFLGDGNGRHGLPGAPAIDFMSGALFVMGLGYSLYRWRSPAYPLLVIWFVVMMQSGILSLDWEAPQQARTVVAIPAIYAIASIPLAKVWGAWNGVAKACISPASRRVATLVVSASVIAVLTLIVYVNYDRYFNRQMRSSEAFYAFSTVETVVARRVAELGPMSNRYYVQAQDTPSFQFLAGGDSARRPVDAVTYRAYAHMPLREPITKTAVYLLEPWRVTLEPSDILRYYPNAAVVEHKDPFGKTMVFEFRVPPDDVSNLLGLRGRYYAGLEPQGTPLLERTDKSIAFAWGGQPPVQGPFNVEWTGSIVPPEAGQFIFEVVADGQVRMSLDGEWLDITPGKPLSVDLAKGQHPVTILYHGNNITLYWTPPRGQRQVVPTTAMLAVGWPEHGLVGRYYRGESWQGRPEFIQVDPYLAFRWHPDPIEPGPWSATWTGKIDAPIAGKYLLQGVSNDRFWLIIDGRTYLNGTQGMNEIQIDLQVGKHDIQVKYANNRGYSELRLMWRRPDGVYEVVPNSALSVN